MGERVAPGVTTLEINELALDLCRDARARPLFLNYTGHHEGEPNFPGAICPSPYEVVVNTITLD